MRDSDIGRRAGQEGRGRNLSAWLGMTWAPYTPRATWAVLLRTKCPSVRTIELLSSLMTGREKGKEGRCPGKRRRLRGVPGRGGKDARGMRTEEARIGASVRVGEGSGLPPALRGLLGTVSGTWANPWGAPEDLVLEVRLDDGRTRLFWKHELEGVAEGAY